MSVTKLPQESRRSRVGTSGLPHCASDFVGKSMFSQHRPETWDDVRLPRFVDHVPMGLAPTVETVPDRVQQLLAEQCNLHCHTDELGLPYWYHGDHPGTKHYCAVEPTVDQQFVIPQTFGKRCIQPRCTVDYQHAQPKKVSIYMRPLLIVDSGAVGNVLPVPPVSGHSFEEDRLTHWLSSQDEGQGAIASSSNERSALRSYSIGGHVIFPHLRYYPENGTGRFGRNLSAGSQSSVVRSNSGVSRPSAKRPTPTPTPSASSSSRAANTGTPAAPDSKRMPKAKPSRGRMRPAPRTLVVAESSSDDNQN